MQIKFQSGPKHFSASPGIANVALKDTGVHTLTGNKVPSGFDVLPPHTPPSCRSFVSTQEGTTLPEPQQTQHQVRGLIIGAFLVSSTAIARPHQISY